MILRLRRVGLARSALSPCSLIRGEDSTVQDREHFARDARARAHALTSGTASGGRRSLEPSAGNGAERLK
jgi:hypothetical protein